MSMPNHTGGCSGSYNSHNARYLDSSKIYMDDRMDGYAKGAMDDIEKVGNTFDSMLTLDIEEVCASSDSMDGYAHLYTDADLLRLALLAWTTIVWWASIMCTAIHITVCNAKLILYNGLAKLICTIYCICYHSIMPLRRQRTLYFKYKAWLKAQPNTRNMRIKRVNAKCGKAPLLLGILICSAT